MKLHPTVLLAAALASGAGPATARQQSSAQPYTRYELFEPGSARFRIVYDVAATSTGAERYFNGIRPGSAISDVAVFERGTGAPLETRQVSGEEARRAGLVSAVVDMRYLQVALPYPVPDGGEVRLRIEKTYEDAASYRLEGEELVFERRLGIRRNAVLLPAGWELVGCNVSSQVLMEESGRLLVSFMNLGLDPVRYELRMRRLREAGERGAAPDGGAIGAAPPLAAPGPPPDGYAYPERAVHDRDIVYFLQSPETHSFRLYHDYTERRAGVDRYLNVVRPGSDASDPSAILLDTGAALEVTTLHGLEIEEAGIDIGEPVTEASELVLIEFPAVREGQSVRLRIEETYTDPDRYGLLGEELVWARSFGRNRNRVVLPPGWWLTDSAIPAVVSRAPDGRVQLDFWNPRPDSIYVVVKARRR